MLLTELKANLKDYVYMFKDSSIALRYLYGKCGGRTYSYYAGSKVMHNPGITDARFREVVEAINEEVRKNAIFVFEGLSKSLGILTEDLNLQLTNEESFLQNARVRGAGVGVAAAAVASLLTGGGFLVFAGLWGALGAFCGGDKFDTAANMLYENDKKAGDYLYSYFSTKIDELMLAGKKNTVKVPEYCIYDAKNVCEKCGKRIVAKRDQRGWYMGCVDEPRCTYRTKYRPIPKINRAIK